MGRDLDPQELMDQMFKEYDLPPEYHQAWEAMKEAHEKVCADNFKMRVEAMGHGKDAA